MSMEDSIVVDTTTRIFRDLGDPQTIVNAADDRWKEDLWSVLEESGLTQAWTPDDLGGAGASITDGFDVLRVSGAFAASVPLAETLLAGWLLSRAQIVVPPGPMTIAPVRDGDRLQLDDTGVLRGAARDIPFASEAGHIAVLARRNDTCVIALVERADCTLIPGASLANDPQDRVDFDGVTPIVVEAAPDGIDEAALFSMGAAARSAQMAGALQAILDISVEYAKQRVAFGRPIGKFQAVQHNLARLAGETAAAIAAAQSLAERIDRDASFGDAVFVEVAAAKIRVGEAAGEGAAIAHQTHGAIGFTNEHILHRYTMRLWSWRDQFGSESHWAVRLGEHVAAQGADELWPMVTAP
jgi:alkylation response protein AidB-like acyl-CoA dehydrogenase